MYNTKNDIMVQGVDKMDMIQWLIENGGPSIKLNLMNEGLISENAYDTNELVNELLQIEKVKTALTYFDKFKDYQSMRPAPYNDLHGFIHNCYEDCYEMFMRFFINLGFRAGMPIFDEKVAYMREVYRYLMTKDEGYWPNVIMLMLEAGFYEDDMLDATNEFLDRIYQTAKAQCFDIYETDPEKIRHSKLPKIWKDKPILKEIHVDGELLLPTIYHINYIVNLYKYVNDETIKEKIETVIKYILHPEYQKFRGDYGYGWFSKAYYACSGGVSLPLYEYDEFTNMHHKAGLELMSHSPVALGSEWFIKCIDYMEKFKTERGTYILPEDCFYNTFVRPANATVVYKAFISKDVKVKRNEKKSFALEILSTYFVVLLKSRMEINMRNSQFAIRK